MRYLKSILPLTIGILSSLILTAQNKIVPYDEPYRAQYHYTAAENWIGSPVALFERDSVYYMYYQQNPHNMQPGYYRWGLATSSDLISWEEQPMPNLGDDIQPDSLDNCMTWGSIDLSTGKAQAIFSRNGNGIFKASSNDGINWGKAEKVESDFDGKSLEPFLFWHDQSKKWVLINYDRDEKMMRIYNTDQLETGSWEKTSEFNFKYGHPSLVEVPIEGEANNSKWVLFCETGIYFICNFDGKKITPAYAISSFDNGKSVQNSAFIKKGERTIMISGLKGNSYADLPTVGMMGIPCEIMLTKKSDGYVLTRKPIKELELLHNKDYAVSGKKVYPGLKNNPLSKLKGDAFRIKLEIDLQNCDEFNLLLRSDRMQNGSIIMYDVKRKFFNVLGNSVPYEPVNNKIEFEVLLDRSSIELFLDHGEYCFSSHFSPTPKNYFIELTSIGGELIVDYMEAFSIKSIWEKEE